MPGSVDRPKSALPRGESNPPRANASMTPSVNVLATLVVVETLRPYASVEQHDRDDLYPCRRLSCTATPSSPRRGRTAGASGPSKKYGHVPHIRVGWCLVALNMGITQEPCGSVCDPTVLATTAVSNRRSVPPGGWPGRWVHRSTPNRSVSLTAPERQVWRPSTADRRRTSGDAPHPRS